jgi:anti-anti-sigma factor
VPAVKREAASSGFRRAISQPDKDAGPRISPRDIGVGKMEMQVQELDGGITNIVLRGRLDTVSVGGIEAQFKSVAETKRAVVVDLSETDYLSSLGVRLLLSCARALHNKGGKLVLLSPKENVRAVLGIVGVEKFIPVVFDRSAAAAAIKKDR